VSKKIKEFELAALRNKFGGIKDYILITPEKVDALTDYTFRKTLRDKKISVSLVKNSLAKKVLAEGGVTALDGFAGSTLIAWGGDSVKGLATTVDGAIKDSKKDPKAPDKYKVKSAVADGQSVSFEVAKTLPTRQEAIGELLGAILGPGSALAGCLIGPGGQVAGCVAAVEEKGPAAAEAPAAPAA
jgi:large subunit ribosomal protein L10